GWVTMSREEKDVYFAIQDMWYSSHQSYIPLVTASEVSSDGSYTISCGQLSNIDYYELAWQCKDGAVNWYYSNSNEFAVTEAQSPGEYKYSMRAWKDSKASEWGEVTVSVVTPAIEVPVVRVDSRYEEQESVIAVDWNQIEGENVTYTAQLCLNEGGTLVLISEDNLADTSVEFRGQLPGTYWVRVQAVVEDNGASDWSQAQRVEVGQVPGADRPTAPAGLNVVQGQDLEVVVTWNLVDEPVEAGIYYKVQIANNAEFENDADNGKECKVYYRGEAVNSITEEVSKAGMYWVNVAVSVDGVLSDSSQAIEIEVKGADVPPSVELPALSNFTTSVEYDVDNNATVWLTWVVPQVAGDNIYYEVLEYKDSIDSESELYTANTNTLEIRYRQPGTYFYQGRVVVDGDKAKDWSELAAVVVENKAAAAGSGSVGSGSGGCFLNSLEVRSKKQEVRFDILVEIKNVAQNAWEFVFGREVKGKMQDGDDEIVPIDVSSIVKPWAVNVSNNSPPILERSMKDEGRWMRGERQSEVGLRWSLFVDSVKEEIREIRSKFDKKKAQVVALTCIKTASIFLPYNVEGSRVQGPGSRVEIQNTGYNNRLEIKKGSMVKGPELRKSEDGRQKMENIW
ncbi:MAG: hypothetical protein ABIH71_06365, partial [Candidatus Omnitrophota bacterium]